MPRRKQLDEFEKGQIVAYDRECLSIRDIASILDLYGRS